MMQPASFTWNRRLLVFLHSASSSTSGANRSSVASFVGPVLADVDGAPYPGDLHAIPLSAHQQITLEVGAPTVPPPDYLFPYGE